MGRPVTATGAVLGKRPNVPPRRPGAVRANVTLAGRNGPGEGAGVTAGLGCFGTRSTATYN